MIRPSRAAPTPAPLQLALTVLVAAALAWAGLGTLRAVMGMWDLGQGPHPYFLPSEALALYIITPLTALATTIFFLAPGLILSAVFGRDKGVALWFLSAFATAIAVLVAVTTAFQLATGIIPTGHGFFALVLATDLACLLIAGLRLSMGQDLRLKLAGQEADIWMALGLFWACLVLMAPKFYWENFSGDGSGSLQFSRLFIHTLWPFWPDTAGVIKQQPGLTSVIFVIPDSWFVRLWGETEFSVRLPHMMALALLYPQITALIRWGRPMARLRGVDHLLLGATLYLYSLSVIYSGGYHAWFGDSPMPAVRETLAMVCFLGYLVAFVEDRRVLMLVAGLMAHLSLPTGGLFLLLWPVAVAVVWRPIPRGQLIFAAGLVVVAGLVTNIVPAVVSLAGLPIPGEEFGASGVLQRLRYISFTDWNRFAFLAVPVGILPALSLFTWRRQDQMARALTLVTVVFFFFFYFQAYRVLLHHFIPVVFLPLIVLWRSPLMAGRGARWLVAAGLLASLWLAWPRDMGTHAHDRAFAAFIETDGPRFASATPADGERFRGFDPKALDTFHTLFDDLLPIGYGEDEPGQRFFGAPLAWWYYSEFPKVPGQIINYRIKPLTDGTPADGTLFASYDGYGLYVADMALYDQQRNQHLPYDTGAELLRTPRDVLFGNGGHWPKDGKGRLVLDLGKIAKQVLGRK